MKQTVLYREQGRYPMCMPEGIGLWRCMWLHHAQHDKTHLTRVTAYPLLSGFCVVVQQSRLHESMERRLHALFHLWNRQTKKTKNINHSRCEYIPRLSSVFCFQSVTNCCYGATASISILFFLFSATTSSSEALLCRSCTSLRISVLSRVVRSRTSEN